MTAAVEAGDAPAGSAPRPSAASLHALLVRLVGRLPDDAGRVARDCLFGDRLRDLAALLSWCAQRHAVPLLAAEADVLDELVAAFPDLPLPDPFVVGELPLSPEDRVPGPADDGDVLDLVCADGEALGLWACWLSAGLGSPWPPARRCYLVETRTQDAALRLDRALHAAPADARFLVMTTLEPALPEAMLVADAAELIWAREPELEIRVAPLFADVDGEGRPVAAAGEPLPEADHDRLVAYLIQAEPILQATDPGGDVVDLRRTDEVPQNLRSDGTWVWNDAAAYYLTVHGIMPPPDLVEHALTADGPAPALTWVQYHRILEVLTGPESGPEGGGPAGPDVPAGRDVPQPGPDAPPAPQDNAPAAGDDPAVAVDETPAAADEVHDSGDEARRAAVDAPVTGVQTPAADDEVAPEPQREASVVTSVLRGMQAEPGAGPGGVGEPVKGA